MKTNKKHKLGNELELEDEVVIARGVVDCAELEMMVLVVPAEVGVTLVQFVPMPLVETNEELMQLH